MQHPPESVEGVLFRVDIRSMEIRGCSGLATKADLCRISTDLPFPNKLLKKFYPFYYLFPPNDWHELKLMTHCVCLVCRTTNLWVGDVVAGKGATTFRFGVWTTLPTVGEAEEARPTDASARPRSWNSTTRNKMSSKLRFYLLALQINVQGKVLEISVGTIFINVIIAFLLFMYNEFKKCTAQVQGLFFWP